MDRKVSVVVNQPSRPHGEQVEVPGLGLFQNGVPRVITDEDMITFRAVHLTAQELPVDLGDVDEAEYQTSRGQTLARAFVASPNLSVVEEEADKPINVDEVKAEAKEEAKSKKARVAKSSAPVGEDKGTGEKSSDEEE